MHSYDIIYNDADPDQIETLAPTQLHRNVDLEIVHADKAGTSLIYSSIAMCNFLNTDSRLH